MLNNLQINWDKMYNEPTNYNWADILYKIRCDDAKQNLILDKLNFADLTEYYVDNTEIFDALVVPNNKLEKKMAILQRVMNTSAKTLNVITSQRTTPFKKNGVTNIANFFELSDGQTITIFFHNPDTTPNKIAPTDDIISYKWLLNKKDITIVVAPEKGHDLNIREVAKRIMKLAERNSAAFARANKKRAEKAELYSQTEKEVADLETQLENLKNELNNAIALRDQKAQELEQIQSNINNNPLSTSDENNTNNQTSTSPTNLLGNEMSDDELKAFQEKHKKKKEKFFNKVEERIQQDEEIFAKLKEESEAAKNDLIALQEIKERGDEFIKENSTWQDKIQKEYCRAVSKQYFNVEKLSDAEIDTIKNSGKVANLVKTNLQSGLYFQLFRHLEKEVRTDGWSNKYNPVKYKRILENFMVAIDNWLALTEKVESKKEIDDFVNSWEDRLKELSENIENNRVKFEKNNPDMSPVPSFENIEFGERFKSLDAVRPIIIKNMGWVPPEFIRALEVPHPDIPQSERNYIEQLQQMADMMATSNLDDKEKNKLKQEIRASVSRWSINYYSQEVEKSYFKDRIKQLKEMVTNAVQ